MFKKFTYFFMLIFVFIGIVLCDTDTSNPLSVTFKTTCDGTTTTEHTPSNFLSLNCDGASSSVLYYGCKFQISLSASSNCTIDTATIGITGTSVQSIKLVELLYSNGDTINFTTTTTGGTAISANSTITNGALLINSDATKPLSVILNLQIPDAYTYPTGPVYIGITSVTQESVLTTETITDFNGLTINTYVNLRFSTNTTTSNGILNLADNNFTIIKPESDYGKEVTYDFVFTKNDIIISKTFSIKFHFCIKNCKTCNDTGCLECKADYYLVGDENTTCSNLEELTNYYKYGNRIKKCYDNCKTCLIGGSSTANYCTECISGLYFVMGDSTGTCYSTKDGYYKYALDDSNYIFKKCSSNCSSCEDANVCKECSSGFTLVDIKKDSSKVVCVTSTSNYYIDEDYNLNEVTDCPVNYPYDVSILPYQCLKKCPDGYTYIFGGNNKTCYETSGANKPDGYVYISDKDYLQKCKDSNCKSCDENLDCQQCLTNYSLVSSLTGNANDRECYDITFTGKSEASWYIDSDGHFQTCEKDDCTSDTNKCYQIDTFKNLSRCYKSLPGYYVDTENKVYVKCPNNCATCIYNDSSINKYPNGTEMKVDCLTCETGYLLQSELSHNISNKLCVAPCESGKSKFYFDDNSNLVCESSCTTTPYIYENIGTNICSQSCLTGYASIENVTTPPISCYKTSEQIPYYYLDATTDQTKPTFKPCSTTDNSSCISCSNSTYCNKCAEKNSTGTLLYLLKTENNASCVSTAYLKTTYIDANTSGYYIDSDKTVQFCLSHCLTCTNSLKCTQCISGFAFKEEDPTYCYNTSSSASQIEGYQLNNQSTKYIKCNTGCLTCELNKDGTPNGRCPKCDEANDYYHIENDADNKCYGPKYYENDGYYLYTDSTNGAKIIKKCNQYCSTCDQNEPCKTCYSGYGLKTKENEANECWGISEQKDGYIYDSTSNKFLPCHSQCKSCFKALTSESSNHYCKVCNTADYYLLSDDSKLSESERTGNCYDSTILVDNGYFLVDNLIEKCPDHCLKCSDKLSCTLCDNTNNYYNMSEAADGKLCYSNSTVIPGFYLDSSGTTKSFKKCISNCKECTNGTDCITCFGGYAVRYDNYTVCYNTSEKLANYTYEESSNIFKNCDKSCDNCTSSDDPSSPMCVNCANGYSFLVDDVEKRVCHNKTLDAFKKGYYLNEANNTYLKCIDNCETCVSSLNCSLCASGYAYISTSDSTNATKCYPTSNPPEGYYFDSATPTYFLNCSDNCAVCENSQVCKVCKQDYYLSSAVTGVSTDVTCVKGCEGKYWFRNTTTNLINCTDSCTSTNFKYIINNSSQCIEKCEEDFAYKDGDTSKCYSKTLIMDGYTLAYNSTASIFKPCLSNCLVCTYESDTVKPCSKCETNYFFNRTNQADTNTTCELESNMKDKGYFKNNTFDNLSYYKCPENCLICTSSITCKKCNTNYSIYHNDESTITCQPSNTSIQGYGINLTTNEFVQCNTGCLNCSDSNNSLLSQKQCAKCDNANEYYQKNYGSDKTCYKKDLESTIWPPTTEFKCFLNTETNYIEKCIDNCKVCSTNTSCDTCITDFCLKQDLSGNPDKSKCYNKSEIIDNYVYDSSAGTDNNVGAFVPCDETCKKCKIYTDGNAYCSECATDYAFKDDDLKSATSENYLGNCYQKTAVETDGGYYYESSNNIYRKCTNTNCKSCENNLQKCVTCISGAYKKEDILDNCFTGNQTNYYLDSSNSLYKKCPNNCKTCSNDTKCTECNTGYALKEDASTVNDYTCYITTSEIQKYVYYSTDNIFKKCMDHCIKCSSTTTDIAAMTTSKQNCLLCNDSENYYLKEDDTTNKNCYISTDYIDKGYYLDKFNYTLKNCLTNCSSCNDTSTCNKCFNNSAMKVDDNTKCYDNTLDTTTDTNLKGYYYSLDTSQFEKCNANCETCKYGDTTDRHNCESCNSNTAMDETTLDKGYNCYPLQHFTGKYIFETSGKYTYKDCPFENCDYCTDSTDDDITVNAVPESCLKCKEGYYNDTEANICKKLDDGYYIDTNKTLKKCSANCKTCTNNSTCSVCYDGYKMINEYVTYTTERYCVKKCDYRWYITNPTNPTDENTLGFTCLGSNEVCPTGHQFHMDGKLECKSACDFNAAIKEDDTGSNTSTCYNLNDPYPGYYYSLSENKLKKCPSNCEECKNSTLCTKCASDSVFLSVYSKNDSDKLCVKKCENVYYFKEGSSNTIENYVCSTDKTSCSETTEGYTYALDNETNRCLLQCPDGFAIKTSEQTTTTKGLCHNISAVTNINYYYNSDNKTINECYSNCLSCLKGGNDTYNNCTVCATGLFFFDEDKYKGNCYNFSTNQTGYFQNTTNKIYYKCINNCDICSSTDKCTKCSANYAMIEGDNTTCYETNKEILYYEYLNSTVTGTSNGYFRKCPDKCIKCTTNATICTSCEPLYKLKSYYTNVTATDNKECVSECNKKWYIDTKSSNTERKFYCVDDCNDDYPNLDDKQCYNECPSNKFLIKDEKLNTTIKSKECHLSTEQIKGYYFSTSENLFIKCPANCERCNDGVSCDYCNSGFQLLSVYTQNYSQTDCVISCDTNWYLNDTSLDNTAYPLYLNCANENCISNTNDGYKFYVSQKTECLTACPTGFAPKDGSSDDSIECFNISEYNKTEYYYNSTEKELKKCIPNCKVCSDGATCEECVPGYSLLSKYYSNSSIESNILKQCVPTCDTKIYSWHFDEGDVNKFICNYQKNCTPEYPLVYMESPRCIKDCSGTDYRKDGDKCYPNTDNFTGYYANSNTSTFEKCGNNCDTCDSTQCTKCLDGYTLFNNYYDNAGSKDCVKFCDKGLNKFFYNNTNHEVKIEDFECTVKCESSTTGYFFVQEKRQCLTQCPSGYAYILDSGESVSNITTEHKCFPTGTQLDGYYLTEDNSVSVFKSCDTNCTVCKDSDTCIKCNDFYEILKTYTKNDTHTYCVPTCDIYKYNWYINDDETNKFNKFVCLDESKIEAVATKTNLCQDYDNDTFANTSFHFYLTDTHQCLKTWDKDSFAPREDSKGECFPIRKDIPGYYLNSTTNIFNKCDTNCLKCQNKTVCTTCNVSYSLASFYTGNSEDSYCVIRNSKKKWIYNTTNNNKFEWIDKCSGDYPFYLKNSIQCKKQCDSGYKPFELKSTDTSTERLCHEVITDGYEGYFEDSTEYKLCKNNCIKCTSKTTCSKCKDEFIELKEYTKNASDTDCVIKCNLLTSRWYLDDDKNVICVGENKCPPLYLSYNQLTKECIKSATKEYSMDKLEELLTLNLDTKLSNIIISQNETDNGLEVTVNMSMGQFMIGDSETKLKEFASLSFLKTKDKYLHLNLNDADVIYYDSNSTETIPTIFPTISLSTSENKIREAYGMSTSDKILMNMVLPKANNNSFVNEPKVIHIMNGDGEFLNAAAGDYFQVKYDYNENSTVIDIKLEEQMRKDIGQSSFDPTADVFNDHCNNYNPKTDRDMTVQDRRDFLLQENPYCQNCYIDFNFTDKKMICNCSLTTKNSYIERKSTKTIKHIKTDNYTKSTNFHIIDCSKNAFKAEELKDNAGFYISFVGMAGTTILAGVFVVFSKTAILAKLAPLALLAPPKKSQDSNLDGSSSNELKENTSGKKSDRQGLKFSKKVKTVELTELVKDLEKLRIFQNDEYSINDPNMKKYKIEENYMVLNYREYSDSLILDQRYYSNYLSDLIIEKHFIISTFVRNIDLYPIILRIIMLIFFILTFFFWTFFFITEKEIQNRYRFEGTLDLGYMFKHEFKKCLYVILIMLVYFKLNHLFRPLQRRFRNVLSWTVNKHEKEDVRRIKRQFIIRVIIFFIIVIVSCVFYFIYLTSFCFVYKNTVGPWVYQSIFIIVVAAFVHLALCFILGSVRFIGLQIKNRTLFNIGVFLNYLY